MRILALAMATILAVVCLAACGGEEEEGTPARAATPTATVAGTPAAAATPTAARTAAATPTPAGAALAPGSFSDLNSYRYSMKIALKGLESIFGESLRRSLTAAETPTVPETMEMEISGAVVAPDKAEAHMRITGLEDELAITVVGNQQWMKFGDMAMGPTPFEGDLSDVSLAEAMWGGFSEEAGGLTCASEKKETVNGIPCRYCGIDQASFEQLASLFGGTEEMGNISELSLDMWLAEEGGWPVRLRAHVAGTAESGQEFEASVEMDITDVNKEIEIKAPS